MTKLLVSLSLLWATAVSVWAMFVGPGFPPALLIPVAFAALPLVWPRTWSRAMSTLLLFVFSALAAASVGLFYAPAVLLMGSAAIRLDGPPSQPAR